MTTPMSMARTSLIADDVLLSRTAELVRHGHVYLAQPPLYRLTRVRSRSTPWMTPTCSARRSPSSSRRQGRGQPLQGTGRDASGATPGNHDGSDKANPAEMVAAPEERAATADLVESLMGRERSCDSSSSRITRRRSRNSTSERQAKVGANRRAPP